ncbi:GNAT family N-acetyltransferase [Cobetia amphilecti]|uniref:GNAT family N-acetyltransferase n=1 Tax=Cobetia amphilecti TaxID=1055104 RepID=UPI001CDADD31|nr:GNAT family N-acetyltransferase [Cobetia amphilecti]UBU47622.1 GNAT family N-acetyltransferase [Cobetia amphilecti]
MNEIDIRPGTPTDIVYLNARIPEFTERATLGRVASRLLNGSAPSCSLILVAYRQQLPIAYKAGYALNSEEFYSWLDGVLPDHRQTGIATRLREAQERWAREQGYQRIRVKSMKRYPAMLKLLVSAGYQVCAYEDAGTPEASKIVFQKML